MTTLAELGTPATNTWCPGCGNFGILLCVKEAIVEAGLAQEEVVAVTGIGCHGKLTDYLNVNGFHVIHGRVLPVATGIKLANHDLTVIGFAGDGDAFNIGMGHFPHAARRNVDLVYVVHNNMIYGLTTGQVSPTSAQGMVTKTSPRGEWSRSINPLAQALVSGATFVARGFAGEPRHLRSLLVQAIKHRGFALVDVLQPCVSFNRVNTYDYFRERCYKLGEEGHDPGDWNKALAKAMEWGQRIPLGVFFKEEKPLFREGIPHLKRGPLVKQKVERAMEDVFQEFT
ncbi:MAG TPA: 2-oxoacid:ferredoxin oxidoreductase subunit beta [Candidatus Bathyarchaeota archaeon]|nr:2-oxoacid:ferredoxin oxidoreductase subunit beta [Candidatus Bathyarchaeota archaeon]